MQINTSFSLAHLLFLDLVKAADGGKKRENKICTSVQRLWINIHWIMNESECKNCGEEPKSFYFADLELAAAGVQGLQFALEGVILSVQRMLITLCTGLHHLHCNLDVTQRLQVCAYTMFSNGSWLQIIRIRMNTEILHLQQSNLFLQLIFCADDWRSFQPEDAHTHIYTYLHTHIY